MTQLKVCLVWSHGGHLTELPGLADAVKSFEAFYTTIHM